MKKVKKVFLITSLFCFILVLFLINFYFQTPKPKWVTTVLDSKHPERFVSLAVDPKGTPHIAYYDEKSLGGLIYFKAKSSGNRFFDDINYFLNGKREWESETIDNRKGAGFFPSIKIDSNNKPHITYQDSSVGREVLYHSYRDGDRWNIEMIEGGGGDVGNYAFLVLVGNIPHVFYHTATEKKFTHAVRKEGGEWIKEQIDSGAGLLTTADYYNKKIFLTYADRENYNIRYGILDLENGKFTSSILDVRTAGMSLKTYKGDRYLLYFDLSKNEIRFGKMGEEFQKIDDGKHFSRVSLDINDGGFYITYYVDDQGLKYGFSKDGKEWEIQFIEEQPYAGNYNSIDAEENGNVHIAYITDRSVLKHVEFNFSYIETVKKLTLIAISILLVSGLGFLFLSFRRTREEGSKIRREESSKIRRLFTLRAVLYQNQDRMVLTTILFIILLM